MTDAELAELLRTVIARPDDLDVLGVYADVLIERGDPRGELIMVQLQRRVADSVELAARERQLTIVLDTALAAELGHPNTAFSWRRGFIEAVDFAPHDQRRSLVEALRLLGTLPAARMIRRIVIRFLMPGWGSMGPVISALGRVAPQLRSLRELVFTGSTRSEDDVTLVASSNNFGDLAPLLRAVPKLEVLEITSTDYSTLRDVDAPSLKRLVLEQAASHDVARLASMRVPNLEDLEIHGGRWDADLLPLQRTLPLRKLVLVPTSREVMQRVLRDLPGSPLFAGVRSFTLGGFAFDPTCIEYVEHHAARLRSLKHFEIEQTRHAKRVLAALGDIVVVR